MTASALGSVALWAGIVTGVLSFAPRLGEETRRWSLVLAAAFATVATAILLFALLANDFSLAYVAETTSRATPLPYRFSALWGGMDGSMLFYSTLTLLIGARAAPRGAAITVTGLIGTGYLLLTTLFANPFTTLAIPAVDGRGLLAILQHPAMIYHPPILYLGLTIFVVPFALTVASIAEGRLDGDWLRSVRPWLLGGWTLLTVGMVAGASWAYVELGWGGFWAWDPVENTALMPWLAVTVFLHTALIQRRDGRLRRWNAFFAMLPFALTVLGVYLTRSGVTGSIHSFAESPGIGMTLLSAAVLALVFSVVMVLRAPKGKVWDSVGLARDTWLALSAGLVGVALVFVTVGTAYPAYLSVFFGESVTIDTRFFVTTTVPIALAIGVLTAPALGTSWMHGRIDLAAVSTWIVVALAAGVALAALPEARAPGLIVAASGFGGVGAVAMRIARFRPKGRALVSHLAHLGFVMLLVGVGASALGGDFRGTMAPGDSIDVVGRQVDLVDVSTGETGRFVFARARFVVNGEVLSPEIRAYEDQAQPVSEPDLASTAAGDVIIAISQLAPDGETVSVSVFVRPLVWWVWAGALVLALAGLVGLFGRSEGVSRRRRSGTGAPQRGETTTDTFAR